MMMFGNYYWKYQKNMKKSITFDDILILPSFSGRLTKSSPNISTYICGLELSLPVISSPMDTVTGCNMAVTMSNNGGLGIIHRNFTKDEARLEISNALVQVPLDGCTKTKNGNIAIGVAINSLVNDEEKNWIKELEDNDIAVLLIDTAHGHNEFVHDKISMIKIYI